MNRAQRTCMMLADTAFHCVRTMLRCPAWLLVSLPLIFVPRPCLSVIVMYDVGHGDCYAVISDGRVVIVDVGPMSNVSGIVSLLQTHYAHFDRIVVTHVHADHVGGFLTAASYARMSGAWITTDMLVSNHGSHDLDLVINESHLPTLLKTLRTQRIVAADDGMLDALALDDSNMELRGFALPTAGKGENTSGLILKVTEIRDGHSRRAVLFLGDIEEPQQAELFRRPELFRDVGAVTLPHHGRPSHLRPDFFDEVKRLAGGKVTILHSDDRPLATHVSEWNARSHLKIVSTASPDCKDQGTPIDLFPRKTYYQVGPDPEELSDIAKVAMRPSMAESGHTLEDVTNAVAAFTNRNSRIPLPPRTVLSLPSNEWVTKEIPKLSEAAKQQTDVLIDRLASGHLEDALRAERELLSNRIMELSPSQFSNIQNLSPGAVARWRSLREALSEGTRQCMAYHTRDWRMRLETFLGQGVPDQMPAGKYDWAVSSQFSWSVRYQVGVGMDDGRSAALVKPVRAPGVVTVDLLPIHDNSFCVVQAYAFEGPEGASVRITDVFPTHSISLAWEFLGAVGDRSAQVGRTAKVWVRVREEVVELAAELPADMDTEPSWAVSAGRRSASDRETLRRFGLETDFRSALERGRAVLCGSAKEDVASMLSEDWKELFPGMFWHHPPLRFWSECRRIEALTNTLENMRDDPLIKQAPKQLRPIEAVLGALRPRDSIATERPTSEEMTELLHGVFSVALQEVQRCAKMHGAEEGWMTNAQTALAAPNNVLSAPRSEPMGHLVARLRCIRVVLTTLPIDDSIQRIPGTESMDWKVPPPFLRKEHEEILRDASGGSKGAREYLELRKIYRGK